MICLSCGQDNRDSARFCDGCGTNLTTAIQEVYPVEFGTSQEFVGRGKELVQLKSALEEVRSGKGRLIMLVGEPGIGKTRTAQELGSHAEKTGFQVMWGRCYEGEGAPPYWPWVQPIRSYVQNTDPELLIETMGWGAADIAEVVPEIRQKLPDLPTPPHLEPEQARFRLYDSCASFFKTLASSQPLVVVLDDLHWADRSSLLLLEFLAHTIHTIPLLILGTYRDIDVARRHPLYHALGNLIREQRFGRIKLHGLSQVEVSEFLNLTTGATLPIDLVEAVYGRTDGNPLFIGEIARELSHGNPGNAIDPTGNIPEGVKEAVSRRLDRVSEGCDRLLTIASVIGKEFSYRPLELLMEDLSEEQFHEFLDEAIDSHIIEEIPRTGERYQFSHALIQETLYQEISARRKGQLHYHIGESLEKLYGPDVGAHAAELAHHFSEAWPISETGKLVYYSQSAGDQALVSHAYEEALRHYQRALAAKEGQPIDSETAELWFGLSQAQVSALERTESVQALDNLGRAFEYFVESGDVKKAVTVAQFQPSGTIGTRGELISRALDLVEPGSSEAGWLQSRYIRVQGTARGDYQGAINAFDQALAIALRDQDRDLEMTALVAAAHEDAYNFQLEESLRKDLRAIELAGNLNQPIEESHARYELASVLCEMGDLEGAALHAAGALEAAKRSGSRVWRHRAMGINGVVCAARGEFSEARAFYESGLAISPRDPLLLLQLAVLEYQFGNFQQGEAYWGQAMGVVGSIPGIGTVGDSIFSSIAEPMIRRIQGKEQRLDTARAEAGRIVSSPAASQLAIQQARVGLALISIQEHDRLAAEGNYTALAPMAGTIPCHGSSRGVSPAMDRLLGLLAHTMGNMDQATSHFEDALEFCRKGGYRPELAWSCCDFADALIQRNSPGDREKARILLYDSLSISGELAMGPLAERAQARMDALASTPTVTPAYPDGLSEREVEVLRLVARGKSNREIGEELVISEGTARRHVSNIYQKISTNNRSEATVYALRKDLLSPEEL